MILLPHYCDYWQAQPCPVPLERQLGRVRGKSHRVLLPLSKLRNPLWVTSVSLPSPSLPASNSALGEQVTGEARGHGERLGVTENLGTQGESWGHRERLGIQGEVRGHGERLGDMENLGTQGEVGDTKRLGTQRRAEDTGRGWRYRESLGDTERGWVHRSWGYRERLGTQEEVGLFAKTEQLQR